MSRDIRMSLQDMQKAVDRMSAEVLALAAQQPAIEKALKRAIAKAREAAKKADLPSRFSPSIVTAESSSPKDVAAKFRPAKPAAEPKPVSADNAPPVAVVTIGATSYNVSEVTFSADGKDSVARALQVGAYISATLQTEAGDSLATSLAKGPTNVVLQSGEMRLRGFSMTGIVVNAKQPGKVAILLTAPSGSLKAV